MEVVVSDVAKVELGLVSEGAINERTVVSRDGWR